MSETRASFFSYVESFEGEPPRYSLARAFAVDPSKVGSSARALLPELDPHAPLAEEATDFATAYRAYWCFQDLMELVVTDEPLQHRHYFYYESLGYLREIAHCLLSGNYLAVLTLQRPFLELAVFHLYWRSRPDEYAQFYRWIRTGEGKPPFKNAVQELFKNLDAATYVGDLRAARLRQRIQSLYVEACSYNHVAHIQDSYVALNAGNTRATLRAAAASLAQARLCIRQVLLLYGLAYPMVLFSRSLERKFGIGGPVGLVAPHETSALFRAAVGEENFAVLLAAYRAHPEVTSKLEWFDSHADISDEALESSWQDHLRLAPMDLPPTDTKIRVATARASWRTISWTFSYAHLPDPFAAESGGESESDDSDPMKW